jgi:hypothetical protein
MKYLAPSCLPYCAAWVGLNTGFCCPSTSAIIWFWRSRLITVTTAESTSHVSASLRMALSCESMCSVVSFWNGKTATLSLPRSARHCSMTGETRRLFRFSESIRWMSSLSIPVLMAGLSIDGSEEPRTYSLPPQPETAGTVSARPSIAKQAEVFIPRTLLPMLDEKPQPSFANKHDPTRQARRMCGGAAARPHLARDSVSRRAARAEKVHGCALRTKETTMTPYLQM